VGVRAGQRVLGAGCGPGALTSQLVRCLGTGAVSAIDPSASYVGAVRGCLPGVDIRHGVAERLPSADGAFDAAVAQLVVQFMADPVAGLAEMGRVTRPGGVVAACVWDHAGGAGPLAAFWQAVHDLDPDAAGEAELPGAREGHLGDLCVAAGLRDVQNGAVTVGVTFATFAGWWQPFTLGVGPASAYVSQLDRQHQQALRTRCAQLLPPASFHLSATAWTERAHA
jgi:SAM-dependent methyltransferase